VPSLVDQFNRQADAPFELRMSGVMTERVYEDTIRGYDFAKRIAGDRGSGPAAKHLGRDRHAGRRDPRGGVQPLWLAAPRTSRWSTWASLIVRSRTSA